MKKEYKLSACPLDCFDVCSMRAEIIDGKVVRLEGNKEHPITQGFICEKGRKHVERMYSPMRIKRPMKKVKDGFIEISWDEALDLIADKLNYYIDNYGTLSIAQYNDGGAGGLLKNIENLFFDYLGGVTLFKGSLCWGAGMAAQKSDFGDVKGHYPTDMYKAKTIIIWGRNPAETNIHLMPFLKHARDMGAKLILIDPIKTATASQCDWHIQLKPGGDGAFAMAAAKYLLENELYDKYFIENYTIGLQPIKDLLTGYSYEELLSTSGVDFASLERFVSQLIDKPATVYIGYGVQRYNFGGTTVRAIDLLGALSGNIGISGGGVNYANKIYGDFISWDTVAPLKPGKHRYIVKPRLAEELASVNNPKVKVLFISRSNPAVQQPNSNEAINAISSVEFKVVLDYFMTDTARLADLILPVTYFLEETDIMYSSMWQGSIHYNEKLVDRLCETKPEYEIYSLLASKLGIADFPQMTELQWIEKLLEGTKAIGLNLKQLVSNAYAFADTVDRIPWSDYKFNTESGKFEIMDADSLKQYMDSHHGSGKYYYKLITVHMRESLHSQHVMESDIEHPEVFISLEDQELIEAIKLKEGELVKLENQYGSLKAVARLTDKCQKGVLFMKQGWWRKNGGSVNILTSHAPSDIGNQATYNQCRVKIVKLGVIDE